MADDKKLIGVCLSQAHTFLKTDFLTELDRAARREGYGIVVFNSFMDGLLLGAERQQHYGLHPFELFRNHTAVHIGRNKDKIQILKIHQPHIGIMRGIGNIHDRFFFPGTLIRNRCHDCSRLSR